MTATVLALYYCGSIAAALAMDSHHQAFDRRAFARDAVALRLLSGGLFLCALASAILLRKSAIGVIAASVGALSSAVALAYAPRLAVAIATAIAIVAMISCLA